MRTLSFIVFVCGLSINSSFAQKFGYVDTDYILNQMPEYTEAKGEIEKLSIGWQDEITTLAKEIDAMEAKLLAEEVLLTKEMKDERQEDIETKRTELKEYQKKVFGFEGLFFLKKKELIKPVQDKVFDAVEVVAKNNRLQIIFDKSGDLVMIYTDPIHDYTDYVLEELGLGDQNDVIKD